jgi:dTDP-6-deoxy-L-talose 4-dehydrogenase (NAD+)
MIAAASLQTDETGIINVCSGFPEPLADRVERFIQENRLDIRLDYGKFPDRPYDSPAVWGDAAIIKRIMSK